MTTGRDFIGPFQLIRLIRAGTTTQVWEAKRNNEKERVALKILMQEYRKNKSEIADLKHEANVGAMLSHPNVINIYGFHDEHGLPLLAMQLFNAKNLKIELRENPDFVTLNLKEIIQRCAEGLAHLHSHDWVHCDVKPDNFLADEQANVKLIDFSIAVKAAKTKGLGALLAGKAKTIKGTRSYLAPEQIRRKPLDQRTDMYGFGCVVFEMFAGRTPFSATNPNELLNKHLKASVPSLEASSAASKPMADLVKQMMAKNPDDRPSTMNDFLAHFNSIQLYKAGRRPKKSSKQDGIN